MAYINAQETASIRKALKEHFPKCKFSVVKGAGNYSVRVALMSSPIDFSDILKTFNNVDINEYYLANYGQHKNFLGKVIDVIKFGGDNKWYDNSDIQSDYFDTAFYIHFSIGKYNKPYIKL